MEIQIHRNSCSSMETRKVSIDTSSNPAKTQFMEIQIYRNPCSSMEPRRVSINTSSNPTNTCSMEIKIYRNSCSPTTRMVSINTSTYSTGTCFYKTVPVLSKSIKICRNTEISHRHKAMLSGFRQEFSCFGIKKNKNLRSDRSFRVTIGFWNTFPTKLSKIGTEILRQE